MASVPVLTALKGLTLRLGDLNRGPQHFDIALDGEARAAAAAAFGLVALNAYRAAATVKPWLDGAELQATWSAEVVQTCGVLLEDFSSPLAEAFTLRVLPKSSPNAPIEQNDVEFDPDAADPPDLIEDDVIDVGAYLLEQLGLAIDPFPRKPGAVFEPPEPEIIVSPFAALKALKPD